MVWVLCILEVLAGVGVLLSQSRKKHDHFRRILRWIIGITLLVTALIMGITEIGILHTQIILRDTVYMQGVIISVAVLLSLIHQEKQLHDEKKKKEHYQ